jgi:hypothetical protein
MITLGWLICFRPFRLAVPKWESGDIILINVISRSVAFAKGIVAPFRLVADNVFSTDVFSFDDDVGHS